MPDHEFDDADDVYGHPAPPPHRTRTTNAPAVILAIVLGVGMLSAVVCGGVLLFAWRSVPAAPPQPVPANPGVVNNADPSLPVAKPGARRLYMRQEFKNLVMGKTAEGVLAAVGKPDATTENGTQTWIYRRATRDPFTGKVDGAVYVDFNAAGVV